LGKDRHCRRDQEAPLSSYKSDQPDRAFFGRRKGKQLTNTRGGLLDRLLPLLRVPLSNNLNPKDLFSVPVTSLALEIGFGGGEHLLHQARLNPQTGFIGCEPFVNGMAKMLAAIEKENIKNIRVFDGDAIELLKVLSPATFDRIFILYPDPWPKRRQNKRRFISDLTIALLAKVLKPTGELRFATDIDHYAGWTLAHLFRSRDFLWTAEGPDDWRKPWANWIETRYEAKARREGRLSSYLTFTRV
jgi:tRNA (guanine-N7-)-methyltransferase